MTSSRAAASGAVRRVAVVGAGYIADFHVKAIKALGGAELVAVCDLSRTRVDRFADSHGIQGRYTDLGKLLAECRPDVVHVLTPPNAHFEPCRQALEGAADVLVEKPLCHTVAECAELVSAAARTARTVGVS
ncbi:MAG: Gfo/Idh/MocA family oxidoreductase, partial [Myxococcaceae bacterium]|nr:Gfo/Idh/MocA family oxidoreductase [Myxococcaceae bacterium]